MRVTKLQLQDFRGFAGEVSIAFPPGPLAVIIGPNGAGKSTVADALAELLTGVPESLRGSDLSHPLTSRPRTADLHAGADLASIKLHLEIDGKDGGWAHWIPENPSDQPPFEQPAALVSRAARLTSSETVLPLVNYQHASSSRSPEPADAGDFWLTHPRLSAYDGAFDSESLQFEQLEHWYEQEENLENEQKIARSSMGFQLPTLKAVRRALTTFLRELGDRFVHDPRVVRSRPNGALGEMKGRLALAKGEHALFLDQLSDGERRLVLLVMDTARRAAILNPDMQDPLDTPGVVLIDEVELHLHPRWQRKVLPALVKTFPAIQFIVTTHSPQVLSSVPNEALVVLDGGKVLPGQRRVWGRDSNAILTDVLGVSERPDEVEDELRELARLIDRDPAAAVPKLHALEEKLGSDDADIARARALIDFMTN